MTTCSSSPLIISDAQLCIANIRHLLWRFCDKFFNFWMCLLRRFLMKVARVLFALLRDCLQNQSVGTMLWKCSRVTHQAIIAHQFIIITGAIVSDGMLGACVVSPRT